MQYPRTTSFPQLTIDPIFSATAQSPLLSLHTSDSLTIPSLLASPVDLAGAVTLYDQNSESSSSIPPTHPNQGRSTHQQEDSHVELMISPFEQVSEFSTPMQVSSSPAQSSTENDEGNSLSHDSDEDPPTSEETTQASGARHRNASTKRRRPSSPFPETRLGSEHPIDVDNVASIFEPIVRREYVWTFIVLGLLMLKIHCR
jgi:hypothetical protein